MKSVNIFILITLVALVLIESCDSQGSPAASIGAYLTLYKEREKKRKEAENRKKIQNGQQRNQRGRDQICPYIGPCYYRFT